MERRLDWRDSARTKKAASSRNADGDERQRAELRRQRRLVGFFFLTGSPTCRFTRNTRADLKIVYEKPKKISPFMAQSMYPKTVLSLRSFVIDWRWQTGVLVELHCSPADDRLHGAIFIYDPNN